MHCLPILTAYSPENIYLCAQIDLKELSVVSNLGTMSIPSCHVLFDLGPFETTAIVFVCCVECVFVVNARISSE